jgi:NDP-sugar pyrophosphorylase family protein
MLDVDGAPVIERLVERMELAACSSIRVVTRPEKTDVRRYAEARGLEVVLGHPAHIGESVAAGLAGTDEDLVALGFPDSIWEPREGFALLLDVLHEDTDVVLGLFDFDDPERADVVVLDERGRVRDILVKTSNPPSSRIWGCLVARADALRHIERCAWPSDHLRPLVRAGSVGARYLSDRYVDIGTPASLANARERIGLG